MRAGKVVSGSAVLNSIRVNQAKLVLYASDASANTKKQIINKSAYYHIEAYEVDNSELLSRSIGKNGRMAIAIVDDGFARKLKEKLGVGDKDGKNE